MVADMTWKKLFTLVEWLLEYLLSFPFFHHYTDTNQHIAYPGMIAKVTAWNLLYPMVVITAPTSIGNSCSKYAF